MSPRTNDDLLAEEALEIGQVAAIGELVEGDDFGVDCGVRTRRRTKLEPMNPAAPVTRIVCMIELGES